MEVDRVLYIFGSFTRKKTESKRKSLQPSSVSAGNSPLHLPLRSRSYSNSRPKSITDDGDLEIRPRTSAYESPAQGERFDSEEWECSICRKYLAEPRLLACLHSFCTRCLQSLPQEGETEIWKDIEGE
ncbi:hypothetical protein EVAR_64648_1 [Eumeta japonica]|uniref:RING-type domain-containing protein n=1 Tax=Eumeta variegata TaxID=151549 RepID=A0A4C1ZHB9_EUMVA|nr:hypothetical protein EVAR_64648_1 [Eumeta japonica]